MNDSQPTNEGESVDDFFSRQREAESTGDSDEKKHWYVEEFQRREVETRRRTKPWRYLGYIILALMALYALLTPWAERGFLDMGALFHATAFFFVVGLVVVVGFMTTRMGLKCPKCQQGVSKLVKGLCLHCAARLRPDGDLQLGPKRRSVLITLVVIIASVGFSWLGARLYRAHKNRQAAAEINRIQEEMEQSKDEKTLWEFDLRDMEQRRKRQELLELAGNPQYAKVIQVRRALGECWITCEENGKEIARSEPVRLPLDTLGASSISDELVCTAILWEKRPQEIRIEGGEFTKTERGTSVKGGKYRQVLEFSAVLVVVTPSATCKSDVTRLSCISQGIVGKHPDDLAMSKDEKNIATETPVGSGELFTLLELHRRFPKLRSESNSVEDEPFPQNGVEPEIVIRLMAHTMDTEGASPSRPPKESTP